MKKPGLPRNNILTSSIPMVLLGMSVLLAFDSFASDGSTKAGSPAITQSREVLENMLEEGPSGKRFSRNRKITQIIFGHISRELQLLEQKTALRNSGDGEKLIRKVKTSLRKIRVGQRKYMVTGQEPSLAPF